MSFHSICQDEFYDTYEMEIAIWGPKTLATCLRNEMISMQHNIIRSEEIHLTQVCIEWRGRKA